MLNEYRAERIFIVCGYTDLRRGTDRLAGIVQQKFQLDPFASTMFLFCGRRRDRIKALLWERYEFLLLNKRLESGSFHWLRTDDELHRSSIAHLWSKCGSEMVIIGKEFLESLKIKPAEAIL